MVPYRPRIPWALELLTWCRVLGLQHRSQVSLSALGEPLRVTFASRACAPARIGHTWVGPPQGRGGPQAAG